MWIDKKGVVHTVALPQPDDYVDPEFLAEIRLHRAELDYEYRGFLEDRAIAEFKSVRGQFAPRMLGEQALPDDFTIGSGSANSGEPIRTAVSNAIAQLPVEWRLDAVMVLGALLDEWDH